MPSQQDRPSTHSLPTRNPRRRTRQEIDGGASSLRQTRAKRSKLEDGTSDHRHANGHAEKPTERRMNGHAAEAVITIDDDDDEPPRQPVATAPPAQTRAAQRRSLRDEGQNILAKTDCYQASQLPGTPDELHDKEEDFNGMTLPSASLALAVTYDKAYVWNYAHAGPASALREFTLPHPSRGGEPLPVATLVRQGDKGDTGLVVVSSKLGKITFWESIDNAAALSLFEQKRNGSEGDVGGMFSGESITGITHAAPAGYILSFSSGRVAQLSLWDSQSRPSISVRFLKSSSANKGYLGGIWNALGVGGYLKDVVTVRAQMSRTRGLADVIIAAESATLQHWQLGWSTQQPILVKEIEAINTLRDAIGDRLQNLPSSIETVSLVDCMIASSEGNADGTTFSLVCLACVAGPSFSKYVLVELALNNDGSTEAANVYPLDSYAAPLNSGLRWMPRLSYPSQSSTIFVVFEKAVTIFYNKTRGFQETLYLKQEEDVHVVGVNAEPYDERKEEATVIVHVRGNGPVRLQVHQAAVSNSHGRLSARTQIEQAVFYGTRPLNPFDLGRSPEVQHPQDDVEDAVLAVSRDILRSHYSGILPAVTAVDYDIQRRSQALDNLAKHIKHAGLHLSRGTKWKLLWEAEKLAAARRIWAEYDQSNTGNVKEVRLLPELIEYLHPSRKTASEDRADQLRQFLRYDLDSLQDLLPFLYLVIYRLAQRADIRDTDRLLLIVNDGGDLIKGALGEAFIFRERNLWLYGLENEKLKDGILENVDSYRGLPEFWTSTHQAIRKVKEFIENAQTAALDENDQTKPTVLKIIRDNPIVLREWSRAVEERHRWCLAQAEPRIREEDEQDYAEAVEGRSQLLIRLAEIGQINQGLDIAQKYSDMPALTKLVRQSANELLSTTQATRKGPLDESASQRAERLALHRKASDETAALEARVRSLFDQLGTKFTYPYFEDFLRGGVQNTLLSLAQSFPPEAKQYLDSDPKLHKYAWFHDIVNEKDYGSAAMHLTSAASRAEDCYSKKVMSSFSKLAILAATETEACDLPLASYYRKTEAGAEILNIQQILFNYVHPILYGCVDQDAELQQLMAELARDNVAQRDSFTLLIEANFKQLIARATLGAEELADILSLMDPKDLREYDEFTSFDARHKHGLALRALHAASGLDKANNDRLEFARQTVWRRAYIEDDWHALTSVKRQNDEQQEAMLRETVLFATMVECVEAGILSETNEPPKPHALLPLGVRAEAWRTRFGEQDVCSRFAADTAVEAEFLADYLGTCDIDSWVTTAYELAKQDVANTAERRAAEQELLHRFGDEAMRLETGREDPSDLDGDEQGAELIEVNGVKEDDDVGAMDVDGE